ncbi:MAG: Xaa-Pro peptidase family protein [Planctomycetaceae bacterium]
MLTHNGCKERCRKLWSHIPGNAQWLLIGDPRHVQYFSNFRVNPISFSADQRSLLLLTRAGSAILLTDNFTKRSATVEYFVDQEIVIPWYTHKYSVTNRDDSLCAALQDVEDIWSSSPGILEPEGVSEMVAATVAEQAEWQLVDVQTNQPGTLGDIIRKLRRVKHADEIELLRRCMKAGEAGHAQAFEVVREGVSEFEVYLEVQKAAQQAAGCPCIVYGDFRATNADLHKAGGHPTDYRLKSGDLFILDYSVVIHGYRSDFTNTICVGTPSTQQIKQFDACQEALNQAASLLKEGMRCRDIWAAASEVLERWGFGPLAHHAGHGLGMEHPEPPVLVSESNDTLMAGDVVTLEPGCYIPGVGGMRFEHNYLISETGSEQLSHHHIGLQR